MRNLSPIRYAMTLIELLVVIAIVFLLVSLLMVSVQRVRHSAAFLYGQNNLRQIGVAVHQFSATQKGKLPRNMTAWDRTQYTTADPPHIRWKGATDFLRTANTELLPHLEESNLYREVILRLKPPLAVAPNGGGAVHVFQNPLDPTTNPSINSPSDYSCSYVNNAQVFSMNRQITSVTDGLSNTIFFTEHYKICRGVWFDLFTIQNYDRYRAPVGLLGVAPTFADYGYHPYHGGRPPNGDFYPITRGDPPRTTSIHNVTFQTTPQINQCDPRVPNAASPIGLQVLMGDGAVRTVYRSISPYVFWAAVTPNGRESESPDF